MAADHLERIVHALEAQAALIRSLADWAERLEADSNAYRERFEALERNLGALGELLEDERRVRQAEDERLWSVLHSRTDHLA
jgi:protein tyrosine/serine phosphatase